MYQYIKSNLDGLQIIGLKYDYIWGGVDGGIVYHYHSL